MPQINPKQVKPGTDGQVLTTVSGVSAWAAGGATPAGSTGQVQFNSSNSLDADSNFFWDNTNKRLGIGNSSPTVTLDVTGAIHGSSITSASGLTSGSLSVASSKLTVDTNGNLTKINNVTYSFPGAQATTGGQILTNDGAGNLTWETPSAGSIGGTGSTGGVAFFTASATLSSDAKFNWDNVNKRLGVGISTATPSALLQLSTGDTTGGQPAELGLLVTTQQGTPRIGGLYMGSSNDINFGAKSSHVMNLVTNDIIRASIGTSGSFNVGTTPKFTVDSNGNILLIRNVAYSFPSSQAGASGDVLSNDGSGNLSWVSAGAGNVTTSSNTAGQATFWTGATATGGDNAFWWDNSGKKLGIGTSSPSSALSVGSSSQFQVNSSGNILKINNVAYSFPSAQAAVSGYVLSNDAAGNLSWVAPDAGSLSGTGASSQIPYYTGSSTLAGSTALTWTNGSSMLGVGVSGTQGTLLVTAANSVTTTTNGGVQVTNGTDSDLILRVLGSGNAQISTNASGEFLTFATAANVERMRIATTGNVTIGSTTSTSMFNVGSGAQFQVDNSGNLVKVNNIAYSFPPAQASAASQVLTNDGSGNLTWETSVASGLSGTGVAGQAAFFTTGSVLGGDNGFFWDNTNKRLGLGTTAPATLLSLGASTANTKIALYDNSGALYGLGAQANEFRFHVNSTSDHFSFFNAPGGSELLRIANGGTSIGSTSVTSLFNVGTSNQFQVSTAGDLVKIHNVTYSFPSSQAAGSNYILSNDGSGNLTWIANTASGVTGSAASGQVAVFNGTSTIGGDNTYFWDITNKKLVIGTATAPAPRAKMITLATNSSDASTAPTTLNLANSYLHLGGNETNSNSFRAITFGYTNGSVTNAPGAISFVETNSSGNTLGDFVVYTRSVTTDTAPSERVRVSSSGIFNVGSSQQFQVDTSGNLIKINNVAYSWPSSHGTNGATLTTDASGNLTWATGGGVPNATTSSVGVVQLATQGQAFAGTPDTAGSSPLVVQPSGMLLRRDGTSNSGLSTITNDAITPNARGDFSLDLQANRSAVTQVAGGFSSIALGYRNTTALLNGTQEAEMAIGQSNIVGAYNGIAIGQGNNIGAQTANATITNGNVLVGINNSSIASSSSLRALAFGIANTNLTQDDYVFGNNNNLNSIPTCGVFGASNVFTTGATGTIYVFGQSNTISAIALNQSVTMGFSNTCGGYSVYTLGENNTNNGTYNVCVGRSNTIAGTGGTAGQNVGVFGNNNTTVSNLSTIYVVGLGNTNVANNSIVSGLGQNLQSVPNCVVYGSSNGFDPAATTCLVFGNSNNFGSSSSNALMVGANNNSNHSHSMIFGNSNTGNSSYSIIVGYGNVTNTSSSNFNMLIGNSNSTSTSASNAQVFGGSNSNFNSGSVGLGIGNSAADCSNVILVGVGNNATAGAAGNSMAFGTSNTLGASASAAAAFGNSNTVNNTDAHAFGVSNTVNGTYGFALGYNNLINTTTGNFIALIGDGNSSITSAGKCHAFGSNNSNMSTGCFAFGPGTNFDSGTNLYVIGTGSTAGSAQACNNTFLIGISNVAGANSNNSIAMGSGCTVNQLNAFSFGTNTSVNAPYSLAFGYNNVINTNASTAFTAILGHQNSIIANATQTHVFGNNNTNIGTTSLVVGLNNTGVSIASQNIFGQNNTLTTGCTTPLVVGVSNTMTANSTSSNIFGRSNSVDSTTSTVAGVSNTVDQNCTNANVFGTSNLCHGNSSSNISLFGNSCVVGTASATGGVRASVFGFTNNVQADDGIALGNNCTISNAATQSVAIGYGAQTRVPNTINFGGLPIIRKDNGESAGTELKNYVGMKVIIMSKKIDFNATQSVSLTMPSGCYVMLDEVGAIFDAIPTANSGNATLNFGIASNHTKYINSLTTARLNKVSTKPRRDRFTTLDEDEGETDLYAQVETAVNLSTMGRFYWVVDVIEA